MFKNENLLKKSLEQFHTTCEDFLHNNSTIPEITVTNQLQWPLQFYRDYVSKSQPVLIKGGCEHFPATTKWNVEYFLKNFSNKLLRVDVTPNGYADAVTYMKTHFSLNDKLFLMAEEKQMLMSEFLQSLTEPQQGHICYIQSQNSNLTNMLSEFVTDIDEDVDWASAAFDKKPDAINFWMGDSRAVTSMHKDPYENIYCVIDGYKDFILIPPTDIPYVPYKQFDCGNYVNVTPEKFEVIPQSEDEGSEKCRKILWVDIDPLDPNIVEYPDFKKAHLYKVRVHKGDCLYLPALWFHHVQQSHGAIAVNYWYDMEFDVKYCYNSLLQSLSGL